MLQNEFAEIGAKNCSPLFIIVIKIRICINCLFVAPFDKISNLTFVSLKNYDQKNEDN